MKSAGIPTDEDFELQETSASTEPEVPFNRAESSSTQDTCHVASDVQNNPVPLTKSSTDVQGQGRGCPLLKPDSRRTGFFGTDIATDIACSSPLSFPCSIPPPLHLPSPPLPPPPAATPLLGEDLLRLASMQNYLRRQHETPAQGSSCSSPAFTSRSRLHPCGHCSTDSISERGPFRPSLQLESSTVTRHLSFAES
jgi:hypothetical protein